MKVKRKYVFAEGGDTDYDAIYSALDDYKQSLQPTQQQDEPQPTDEQNQDETDQSSNYEDLLSKYQELEQRLNDYSQSAKTPEQDYGDSFLNFLFNSGEDNSPIDFSRLGGGGGGAVVGAMASKSTGQFKSFDSPEAGKDALIHQLSLYQTGKTRNNVKPSSTLSEAMHVYAPTSDNNNPDQYAKFIANRLGITTDTPISQIDTTKWAEAITQMEGNKSGNNPGNIRRQMGGPNLQTANQEAKRFALSRGLLPGEEMHVDQTPQYVDYNTGRPYKPLPPKSKAYNVPNDVQLSDIHNEQGYTWYTDPKTGDTVDVDSSVLNLPRFRKSQLEIGGYGKYKFAGTVGEQQEGLNNNNYDSMYFPTQGVNTFRGLDNGQPIHISDSFGQHTILTHPGQTVKMRGVVKESRLK